MKKKKRKKVLSRFVPSFWIQSQAVFNYKHSDKDFFLNIKKKWQLLPVTCHLTITLCSFSCQKSPIVQGHGAEGGLVVEKVKQKNIFLFCQFGFKELMTRLED